MDAAAAFAAAAIAAGLACVGAVPALAFPGGDGAGGFPFFRSYQPEYRGDYDPDPRAPAAAAPHRVHRPAAQESKAPAAKPLAGPVLIAVSIGHQHVTVYDNGVPVATSPISSGMKGHATPTGVFSVIQKDRWHESNIYSNAPMPYMQRITWSGIALHAGMVPGYPASHGCIRLPESFAVRLWGMTRMGARVIVAHDDVKPFEFAHPLLAALAADIAKPAAAPPPAVAPPAADGKPTPDFADPPLDVTGPTTDGAVPTAQNVIGDDAFAPGAAFLPGAPPTARFTRFATVDLRPTIDAVKPDAAKPDAPAAAPPEKPERLLRAGPVSLFVSRRDGKLFVRKGFEPVFDMPIAIAHPETPLGTFVFTAAPARAAAQEGNNEGPKDTAGLRWLAAAVAPDRAAPDTGKTKHGIIHEEMPPATEPTAAAALDRITWPAEALERLAGLIGPGASVIISDHGLGEETGRDTDFIVVTR